MTIYTIDSGIIPTHQEFHAWADGTPSRASLGPSFVNGGNLSTDCDGHGSHIASTAVGRAVGVAKDARVVALKVLDCDGSGTIGDVVSALDWVAANAVRPAVVTMSLGVSTGEWGAPSAGWRVLWAGRPCRLGRPMCRAARCMQLAS